jgi:uncharacterized protein
MRCPVCPDATLAVSAREGVEIDYCPDCRGVWLDRGELDKIIERTSREEAPPPRYRQEHQFQRGPYYGKKKKESFFERILDFD